jgi:hypothetical protein
MNATSYIVIEVVGSMGLTGALPPEGAARLHPPSRPFRGSGGGHTLSNKPALPDLFRQVSDTSAKSLKKNKLRQPAQPLTQKRQFCERQGNGPARLTR